MSYDLQTCELVGAYPTCAHCGQRNVVRDAWAEWSMAQRDWILKTTFDNFACDRCGKETEPAWVLDEEFRTKRIQRLNDALRHGQVENASVVLTVGVSSLGKAFVTEAAQAVIKFDAFTEDNDPHEEHDFGSVELLGEKLFWKIDYFDLKLERHSPDAANAELTCRVLTIMLASEY